MGLNLAETQELYEKVVIGLADKKNMEEKREPRDNNFSEWQKKRRVIFTGSM